MSNYSVGDFIIAPGRCLGTISSVHRKEVTIIWKDNELSAKYTFSQIKGFNYQHIPKDSQFKIGDRCEIVAHKKYSGEKGYLSAYHTDDSPEFWVKLDNYDLQIRVFPDEVKFLEDEKEAIAPCQDSHNLTSAQELVQDSASLGCNSDLTLLEPQRLTNTAQTSSNCDTQVYTTMATCEKSPGLQNAGLGTTCTQEESIYLQPPLPALHSPQKANGLEVQTSVIVSPPSSKPLENYSPNSQPLKTSQDSLPAPITQDSPQAHILEAWSIPLTSSGTMRNGLLSAVDTLPVPSLESEYCWLRSPGALSSTGKGRPPGQTKQEAELKRLGLINKGEVLNPAILCQWYEIPETWLDPLECRAATELLEECGRQQEIFSILESQQLPLIESSTSTRCVKNQPLARANAQPETYIIDEFESLGIIKDNLGFGFVVNWLGFGKVPNPASGKAVTYNWERDEQIIAGLAIASQSLIDRFLEENRDYECTHQSEALVLCPSCELQHIYLSGGCGMCGLAPANFLEETKPQQETVQKPKGRQRKGCLYRYIENKKLKNGTIASYPRVIGHRQPDNPTHWRWGFNWEEKIDGEWKGRSIGSVPVGAITLIQSMQNEGVSLEEIIGFIRRSKSKKC